MRSIFTTAFVLLSLLHINAQKVGINTVTPQATLDVRGDVLSAGTYNGINPADPPASGTGTRMMWYVDKGAFRVGLVEGPYWDKNSIGHFSFASGYNTVGRGLYSSAMGFHTVASGTVSFASGASTLSSGQSSTAMGQNTTASGSYSFASGVVSAASGVGTTALGVGTTAKAIGGIAIGVYNDGTDNPSSEAPTDRLFQLGNGSLSTGTGSNAITVLRNGSTGIGTLNPSERLDVGGNINLTGQLKFNNNGGSAGQVLVSNGSSASWQNNNKYIVAENSLATVISGVNIFQPMPTVNGQGFTLTFPALVKITITAEFTINAGAGSPAEPRYFFRIKQGSTIVADGLETYSYMKPQAATFIASTMTMTKYFQGFAPGTYSIECLMINMSATICTMRQSQVMIEILPQ